LMKQPLVVVNKRSGAGAEGFLAVKNSKGDAHQLLIVDNNLFALPMATGLQFNWKDTTPVSMLALEQFVLWTNTQSGYKSAKEYIEAAKAAGPGKFKMGGTGSGVSDHLLTLALEERTGSKFKYVPLKFGAEVANQLVEQNVDSTVNNPAEALIHWRAGTLTAQCVFDDARMPYTDKVTASQSWSDIPTCREAGIPAEFQMLFGILMPPSVNSEQVNYFIEIFRKMVATPEWKSHMENGAFEQTFMVGSIFTDWLAGAEKLHQVHAERRRIRW
jgi:putative tricarboxylic transport membrane protein